VEIRSSVDVRRAVECKRRASRGGFGNEGVVDEEEERRSMRIRLCRRVVKRRMSKL